MQSKNFKNIIDKIKKTIEDGLGDSLIKKLEFEYSIETKEELANFILIFLVLIEEPYYYNNVSNLLFRKVLAKIADFNFITDNKVVFEIIKANAVSPYSGIASFNVRIIKAIIYSKPDEIELISNWTDKDFLLDFNIEILNKRIKENPNQINEITSLLYNCIYNINSEYNVELSKKALLIFKDFLINNNKNFENYLHYFLRFKWSGGGRNYDIGKEIVPEPFYDKIFSSTDSFIKILNEKMDKDKKIYKDILKFIEVYRINNYAVYDSEKLNLEYNLHYNIYKELQV